MYLLVLCVTGVNAVSPALVRIVEMCCYWFCMVSGVNGVSPALVRIVEMYIYWFCVLQV